MAKTIWAYFNGEDLAKIMDFLYSNGIACYNIKGEQINIPPFMSNSIDSFFVAINKDTRIEYTPCLLLNGRLQCGSFQLINDRDQNSLKLFSLIKKHIKKHFVYSSRIMGYYGLGFYNDWLNYKDYCKLPVVLEGEQIDIPIERAFSLFEIMRNVGYFIKPNGVRLRNVDNVDFSFDSFVIYCEASEVRKTITRKTFIHYDLDSECIFVHKNEKKGTFSFILDDRIKGKESSNIAQLFHKLSTGDGSVCER